MFIYRKAEYRSNNEMVWENLDVIKLNSTNSGCVRYENYGKLYSIVKSE